MGQNVGMSQNNILCIPLLLIIFHVFLYVNVPDICLFVFLLFLGENLKLYTDLNPSQNYFMNKIKMSIFG